MLYITLLSACVCGELFSGSVLDEKNDDPTLYNMKSDKLDTGFLSSDRLCCETELLMLQHVQYTPSDLTESSDNAFSEDQLS